MLQYYSVPNNLYYTTPKIKTVIGEKKLIYADWIGTGLPVQFIENYMITKVYPYYSNTHSNSYISTYMNILMNNSKEYLRQILNITEDYILLFTGNGTTAAVNHLVNSINYNSYEKIIIFLSVYEHYSNHLPWIEIGNKYNNVIIEKIPLIDDLIDINAYYNKLLSYENKYFNSNLLIITTVTYCSNVTGYFLPVDELQSILKSFKSFSKYFFLDLGCAAPYINIDCSKYDAVYFSCHKFIGGTSTPGILVGKKCLFMHSNPFCSGGGCVKSIDKYDHVEYHDNLEIRESAGTPNILGIIKLRKVFQLKNFFNKIIENNENYLLHLMYNKIDHLITNYDNFIPIFYLSRVKRLPILSFVIKNIHHNLVVKIMNDFFGIQCRGGLSCSGLLGNYLREYNNIFGWVRISFHWSMNLKDVLFIYDSLENLLINSENYKNLYYVEDGNYKFSMQ